MNRNRRSRMFLLAVAMLLVLGMSACQTASPTAPTVAPTEKPADTPTETPPATPEPLEKVSLEFGYYLGSDSADNKNWPTMVIDELCKKLSIDFSIIGYNDDKLNLSLASGEMSDLMLVNNSYISQIVQGNLAVNLDEYLDKYGSNLKLMSQRNDFLRMFYSDGTGKLYFHTPYADVNKPSVDQMTSLGTKELWNGFGVRWDLYKQIGAPTMKTEDDYIAALKKMHDVYPKTETGDPVYGIGVHNDWGLWGWLIRSLANMGYNQVLSWQIVQSDATNDIVHNYMDYQTPSPFWHDMEFYWKLNQAGLLDPDSFTMKFDEVSAKATKGQYLGTYHTGVVASYYTAMAKEDPNTLKSFVAIPFEGSYGWCGGTSFLGWSDKLTFVSSKSKNIDRAVMFIDTMDSPEMNILYHRGQQGVHWDIVDGKPAVTELFSSLIQAGGDTWAKTGIQDNMGNMIGLSNASMAPDGAQYDLYSTNRDVMMASLNPLQKDFCTFYNVGLPSDIMFNMLKSGKAFDQSTLNSHIASCLPATPDDIKTINAKCDEIVTKAIPKLVMAATQADFDAARDQLISDLKTAGADTLWNWMTTNWTEARKKVDSILK